MDKSDRKITSTHLAGREHYYSKKDLKKCEDSIDFFEKKLENQPGIARYEHLLGSLYAAKGDDVKATSYFKNSLANSNNIMTRNDLALHMARSENLRNPDKFKECVTEFKKAFVIAGDEQPTLHKNLGALYAAHGDYNEARVHARRALEINPNDSSNHRNLSKVLDCLGDQRSALKHNLEAIRLDAKYKHKPHSSSYRAAAVQNLCKGGNIDESVKLISQARIFENKKYECPTTIRTQEIISKIMKRCGDPLDELEKEEKALAEKKAIADLIRNGDLSFMTKKVERLGKFTRENYG